MTNPIINANNLVKTYGRGPKEVEAVRGIDLEVQEGQIFGLVGPDGAGKTTTIQMLCGILAPTAGMASVAGIDVLHDADALGGVIGYMSEGFTLYGDLSVEENIDFFAKLYNVSPKVAADRKEQLLHFARMEGARYRRAKYLSGGMKKKLALACTLIYRPKVLFLDEPTTGVDPVSRQDFWKILYEFLGEGITILVSTPYMDEAERCNRVAMLRRGQILANNTPSILKNQLEGVTVEMTADPQIWAVSQLRQIPSVSQVQVFGKRLHLLLREGQDQAKSLPTRLEEIGVTVADFKITTPSLEDVFIAAIKDLRTTETSNGSSAPTENGLKGPPRLAKVEMLSNAVELHNRVVVCAKDLTRCFGNFTAVNRVSFDVRQGEIFGFLGPNGSGKTTTIRMLCGLLPPTDGAATVANFDVVRQRMAMKPHLGYMSQKFSLYDDLTVGENISFYGDVYGLSPNRLAERRKWVLEMAGLIGKEHLLTRELSGGWKQRLALGCAILHEPQILFLDEPTSGVDPVSRREFWDLIFAFSAQGVTIFITTHYMDEAEHCHKLALLYKGRLIARGSPAQLRSNVKLGSMIEVPVHDPLVALPILDRLSEIMHTSIFADKLHVMVFELDKGRRAIEAALAPHDLIVGPLCKVPISLEDLFNLLIEREEAGENT